MKDVPISSIEEYRQALSVIKPFSVDTLLDLLLEEKKNQKRFLAAEWLMFDTVGKDVYVYVLPHALNPLLIENDYLEGTGSCQEIVSGLFSVPPYMRTRIDNYNQLYPSHNVVCFDLDTEKRIYPFSSRAYSFVPRFRNRSEGENRKIFHVEVETFDAQLGRFKHSTLYLPKKGKLMSDITKHVPLGRVATPLVVRSDLLSAIVCYGYPFFSFSSSVYLRGHSPTSTPGQLSLVDDGALSIVEEGKISLCTESEDKKE